MHFKIIGDIKNIETIASGHGINILKRLNRLYGMKVTALGKRKSKSKNICNGVIMKRHFMICVDSHGYEASLEVRKIYEVITDKSAIQHHQLRVIDESGEDYLYPENYFAPVRLPSETKEKLLTRQKNSATYAA